MVAVPPAGGLQELRSCLEEQGNHLWRWGWGNAVSDLEGWGGGCWGRGPGREEGLGTGQEKRSRSQLTDEHSGTAQVPSKRLQTQAQRQRLRKWVTCCYARKVPAKNGCNGLVRRPRATLPCLSKTPGDDGSAMFSPPRPLQVGEAAGLTPPPHPHPVLQMENTDGQKGVLTHLRAESGSKKEGCCHPRRQKSHADALPCLQLLPPTPGKGHGPHPALGQASRYCQPPPSHYQIHKQVGDGGGGLTPGVIAFRRGWQKGLRQESCKGPRRAGTSGAALEPGAGAQILTPVRPFMEQLPSGGGARSWRMTHLDNGGEAGLVRAGQCQGGGPTTPPSPPENPAGSGAGCRDEGSLSPLHPMLCPPLLATLLSTLPGCWARRSPAQPSRAVWPGPKDKCRLQPEPPGRCRRSWGWGRRHLGQLLGREQGLAGRGDADLERGRDRSGQ